VYGTDVYTAESAVCPAAIHAGVLTPKQSGVVSLLIGSGAKAFKGSTRNGVTTKSYGAWPYSFTFVTDGAPGTINWRTTWSQIPADFTQSVSVVCPPGGRLDGAVWGTDVYTRDSTICVAAVHAGLITIEKGGAVAVKRVANGASFKGSERSGVKTMGWSAVPDAFIVAALPPAAAATSSTLPQSASPTKTSSGVIIAPSASPAGGVTLSPTAPASVNVVRNTSSLMATVRGIAVDVSWSPVTGASWYGVAGESEGLWRRVDAPATTVTYFLPFGDYTFAVGAYFEPGAASTPAAEWPRVTAKVVRPQTTQQKLEYLQSLLELERWRAELEKKGGADKDVMDTIAKILQQKSEVDSATVNTGGR
jgi:hypothetical protein